MFVQPGGVVLKKIMNWDSKLAQGKAEVPKELVCLTAHVILLLKLFGWTIRIHIRFKYRCIGSCRTSPFRSTVRRFAVRAKRSARPFQKESSFSISFVTMSGRDQSLLPMASLKGG